MFSYQHDSKDTVKQIKDRLDKAGYSTWIDEENMGMYRNFMCFIFCVLIKN